MSKMETVTATVTIAVVTAKIGGKGVVGARVEKTTVESPSFAAMTEACAGYVGAGSRSLNTRTAKGSVKAGPFLLSRAC